MQSLPSQARSGYSPDILEPPPAQHRTPTGFESGTTGPARSQPGGGTAYDPSSAGRSQVPYPSSGGPPIVVRSPSPSGTRHTRRPAEQYTESNVPSQARRPAEYYTESNVPSQARRPADQYIESDAPSHTRSGSVVHRPRHLSGPSDLGHYGDAAAHEQRIGDLERQIMDLGEAAVTAEEGREQQFQRHEEDRGHIFEGNERRREEEAAQRRDELMENFAARGQELIAELERRITTIPSRRPSTYRVPSIHRTGSIGPGDEPLYPLSEDGGAPIPAPGTGFDDVERSFQTPTLSPPGTVVGEPPVVVADGEPGSPRRAPSMRAFEQFQAAFQDAAERHAERLAETITQEREELLKEREDATMALLAELRTERESFAREREEQMQVMREAIDREREELRVVREEAEIERERIHAEAEGEKALAAEDRSARVRELEEEVARLRTELEAERAARITDEADTRERERAEFVERDEALRAQLQDITNLVQDNNEEIVRKREAMEAEQAERDRRREQKDNQFLDLRDMVATLLDQRDADRIRAEEKAEDVQRGKSYLCPTYR